MGCDCCNNFHDHSDDDSDFEDDPHKYVHLLNDAKTEIENSVEKALKIFNHVINDIEISDQEIDYLDDYIKALKLAALCYIKLLNYEDASTNLSKATSFKNSDLGVHLCLLLLYSIQNQEDLQLKELETIDSMVEKHEFSKKLDTQLLDNDGRSITKDAINEQSHYIDLSLNDDNLKGIFQVGAKSDLENATLHALNLSISSIDIVFKDMALIILLFKLKIKIEKLRLQICDEGIKFLQELDHFYGNNLFDSLQSINLIYTGDDLKIFNKALSKLNKVKDIQVSASFEDAEVKSIFHEALPSTESIKYTKINNGCELKQINNNLKTVQL